MIDKKTLLIIATIIIASIMYANFNPYASCKRDVKTSNPDLDKEQLAAYAYLECGGS